MATIFEPHSRMINENFDEKHTISLSTYEIDNLKKLLSMMNIHPSVIPCQGGDWVNQILFKLSEAGAWFGPIGDFVNHVGMPTFKLNSYSVLSKQEVVDVKVTVSQMYSNIDNSFAELFQVITHHYYIGLNSHPIADHEIYLIKSRIPNFGEENVPLNPGHYEHADYIVMRALKDASFKKDEQ